MQTITLLRNDPLLQTSKRVRRVNTAAFWRWEMETAVGARIYPGRVAHLSACVCGLVSVQIYRWKTAAIIRVRCAGRAPTRSVTSRITYSYAVRNATQRTVVTVRAACFHPFQLLSVIPHRRLLFWNSSLTYTASIRRPHNLSFGHSVLMFIY